MRETPLTRSELGLMLRDAFKAHHGSIRKASKALGKGRNVLQRAWSSNPAEKRMKLETLIGMLDGMGYKVGFVVEAQNA